MFIALTPGDPNGIGPEITWKLLRSETFKDSRIKILCVGARAPFEALGARIICAGLPSKGRGLKYPKNEKRPFVWLLPAPLSHPDLKLPLRPTLKSTHRLAGYQAGWSIQTATKLALDQHVAALVTGPISKERLNLGGFAYPGHTEMLTHLCHMGKSTPRATMLLANQYLRVSLVTIHQSIKDVPGALSLQKIQDTVTHTLEGLKVFWGIESPRLAVAALNPHAGEHGRFGREEIDLIEPTVKHLQKKFRGKCTLTGPIPADTLFARHFERLPKGLYDAVICLYHDQGLIPVKLLDFHRTVNVTLGLPIIRTSVDHGVGFDIAGQGIANPSSLIAAVQLAVQFVRKSKQQTIGNK